MKVESFLNYQNYRYLWINLGALVLLTAIYIVDSPPGGPSGGTVLGYTYGVIATAGILYLMWFGVRKRSYRAKHTTLKGCLAGHIWLGIILAFIVPMHAGFQCGFNVHTLAYVLMMIVVTSGIWGAYQYNRLAPMIEAHRGGGAMTKLLEQQHLLTAEIHALSAQKSDAFLSLAQKIDFTFVPTLRFKLSTLPSITDAAISEMIVALPPAEQESAQILLSLVQRKTQFVHTIINEARTLSKLRSWLFLHLPISCALIVCVFIHIFAVFYYR